jgi:hypothetical protein
MRRRCARCGPQGVLKAGRDEIEDVTVALGQMAVGGAGPSDDRSCGRRSRWRTRRRLGGVGSSRAPTARRDPGSSLFTGRYRVNPQQTRPRKSAL